MTVKVFVDGAQEEEQQCSGSFSIDVDVDDGQHTIRAQVYQDAEQFADSDERRIFADTQPPSALSLTGPDDFTDHYGMDGGDYVWGHWVGDGGSEDSPLAACGYNSFTNPG